MAGSVAPALALEYAAFTSPFPSVFASASAGKTWNMFVEAVIATPEGTAVLPVSMAVTVTMLGPKMAVGGPVTLQFTPNAPTVSPPGETVNEQVASVPAPPPLAMLVGKDCP